MAAAVGDVYLVTFKGRAFGQVIMLTHHYVLSVLGLASSDQAVADAILDAVKSGGAHDIETPYTDCLITDYVCEEIWAQKIHPTRLRRRQVAGTDAGASPSAELVTVSASLVLQTDAAGRNQQSVKKIGPLTTVVAYVSNGVFTTTQLIDLNTLGGALVANLDLIGETIVLKPCIYHGPVPFPAPDILTAAVAMDTARTQSRRVVGRGI